MKGARAARLLRLRHLRTGWRAWRYDRRKLRQRTRRALRWRLRLSTLVQNRGRFGVSGGHDRKQDARAEKGRSEKSGDARQKIGRTATAHEAAASAANAERTALGPLHQHDADKGGRDHKMD